MRSAPRNIRLNTPRQTVQAIDILLYGNVTLSLNEILEAHSWLIPVATPARSKRCCRSREHSIERHASHSPGEDKHRLNPLRSFMHPCFAGGAARRQYRHSFVAQQTSEQSESRR